MAGRMAQVHVTDRFGGERLDRYAWQAGDVLVADTGYGYRRSIAVAVQQQADVIVRIHPATFPLETEAGLAFNVRRWLRHRGGPEREWQGWCRWEGRRYAVRLVAANLDPAAAQRARHRRRRKAQKAVFKKMKQLLRLNQMRTKHPTSVEATVRALLVAWALHEGTTTLLRTLLRATATTERAVVSSWLLSGLGLDTLRQQVQGTWSEAQVQACLPRLRRFLCSRPRRRVHQESAARAWLVHHPHTPEARRQVA